jgi:branched-chain amino acid transport system substrate-binding protein
MKAKISHLMICLSAVFLMLVFAPVRVNAADQFVKIGHLTDMTGPVSPELIPISRGTAIYFQDLNKKGGVNGIKLDLEWVDTKYQLAAALSGYDRLKDKVPVFYTIMSHATTALKEKFAEDKIPCIFASNATVPFWPPGWVYGLAINFSDDLAMIGDFFLETWKEKRPMKVALMFSDDTFGRSIYDGGVQYLKAKGIEIVAEEPVKMIATDATSQLMRVQKANPDYMLCNFIGATQGVVLKDRLKLGIKIPVGTCHGSWAEDIVRIAGAEASEGIVTPRVYGLQTDDTWGVKLGNELIQKYLSEWSGKPAGIYNGIATGMVLAEAIKLAVAKVEFDKLTGAAIKQYGFDQIRNFDTGGLTAKITYTPADHRGGTSARLIRIERGKPVVIRDWTLAPVCKPEKK